MGHCSNTCFSVYISPQLHRRSSTQGSRPIPRHFQQPSSIAKACKLNSNCDHEIRSSSLIPLFNSYLPWTERLGFSEWRNWQLDDAHVRSLSFNSSRVIRKSFTVFSIRSLTYRGVLQLQSSVTRIAWDNESSFFFCFASTMQRTERGEIWLQEAQIIAASGFSNTHERTVPSHQTFYTLPHLEQPFVIKFISVSVNSTYRSSRRFPRSGQPVCPVLLLN